MSRSLLTTPVVLYDLVIGTPSTATNNIGRSRGLFNRNCILTHVLKPDVVYIARAETVHALGLVRANYDVPAARLVAVWASFYTIHT